MKSLTYEEAIRKIVKNHPDPIEMARPVSLLFDIGEATVEEDIMVTIAERSPSAKFDGETTCTELKRDGKTVVRFDPNWRD